MMGDYPSTSEYLSRFAASNGTINTADALNMLFKALELDGSECRHTYNGRHSYNSNPQHNFRSLEDSSFLGPSAEHNRKVSAVIMVVVCLICAGLASGLTQGLLSLDLMEMTIKLRSGTPDEKLYASKVLPVISRHHQLLVTLMLWNASATEALPVFLSCVVPEYLAIIISVTMVLFVGEIIPAAILTGPKQLQIAAALIPLVYVVNMLFFPLAYPISLVLDYVLGHDEGMTVYTKKEIATLMIIQHEEGARCAENRMDALHYEEVSIIDGALKFREMLVSDVMTPISKVFMLSYNEKLTAKTLERIFQSGFSRIPIYERDINDVVGIIRTKDLLFVNPEDYIAVSSFVMLFGRVPLVAWHDDQLGETIEAFRRDKSHIAVVRNVNGLGPGDPFYEVVGIITLEDIVEEILGTEIQDGIDYTQNLEESTTKNYKRNNHLARLHLLNSKIDRKDLTRDQVEAIASHLIINVRIVADLFKPDNGEDFETLCSLVQVSPVLNLNTKTSKSVTQDTIFQTGRPTSCCALVLNGIVGIESGLTTERVEKGPWTVIAPETLLVSENDYIPDFTATVMSDSVHVLMINIHSLEACSIPALQKRKMELGLKSKTLGSYIPPNGTNNGITKNLPSKSKNVPPTPTPTPTRYPPSSENLSEKSLGSSSLDSNQYGSLFHLHERTANNVNLGDLGCYRSSDSDESENCNFRDSDGDHSMENIGSNTGNSTVILASSQYKNDSNISSNPSDISNAGYSKTLALFRPKKTAYNRLSSEDNV